MTTVPYTSPDQPVCLTYAYGARRQGLPPGSIMRGPRVEQEVVEAYKRDWEYSERKAPGLAPKLTAPITAACRTYAHGEFRRPGRVDTPMTVEKADAEEKLQRSIAARLAPGTPVPVSTPLLPACFTYGISAGHVREPRGDPEGAPRSTTTRPSSTPVRRLGAAVQKQFEKNAGKSRSPQHQKYDLAKAEADSIPYKLIGSYKPSMTPWERTEAERWKTSYSQYGNYKPPKKEPNRNAVKSFANNMYLPNHPHWRTKPVGDGSEDWASTYKDLGQFYGMPLPQRSLSRATFATVADHSLWEPELGNSIYLPSKVKETDWRPDYSKRFQY